MPRNVEITLFEVATSRPLPEIGRGPATASQHVRPRLTDVPPGDEGSTRRESPLARPSSRAFRAPLVRQSRAKLLRYLDLSIPIAWQDEHMADNGEYDKALLHLQEELVKMQQWVRDESQRVVIVIEGRDAAGKGGVIKRITDYLNPRWCRIAALPAPSDRERASGTSSATSPTFPPEGRSSCSTAAGTTGPGWSG